MACVPRCPHMPYCLRCYPLASCLVPLPCGVHGQGFFVLDLVATIPIDYISFAFGTDETQLLTASRWGRAASALPCGSAPLRARRCRSVAVPRARLQHSRLNAGDEWHHRSPPSPPSALFDCTQCRALRVLRLARLLRLLRLARLFRYMGALVGAVCVVDTADASTA